MAAGTREFSPANSTIFGDLLVSTNFGISNGKLGFDFLLPSSACNNVPFTLGRGGSRGSPISTAPVARNKENPRFVKNCCWSKERYQILLIKCGIYVRSQVDPRVPNDSDGQKHGKSKVQGWLLKKEFSPANSTIFVDLLVSTNFGISNGKLGFDFLLPSSACNNVPFTLGHGGSRGSTHFSGSDGQKH